MQRVGVCNLVFFVFFVFLFFCFFGFLFFLVRWFVSEGLVKSVGRPYSLPLLPFQGLQTCVQLFLACFGSVVSLENHVKTMEKCMYFWGKLKALGPGVGNSVIEGF